VFAGALCELARLKLTIDKLRHTEVTTAERATFKSNVTIHCSTQNASLEVAIDKGRAEYAGFAVFTATMEFALSKIGTPYDEIRNLKKKPHSGDCSPPVLKALGEFLRKVVFLLQCDLKNWIWNPEGCTTPIGIVGMSPVD